jgi:hypothetical protein
MIVFQLWLSKHPLVHGALISVSVALLSALANWFLRLESPLAWEELKQNRPRVSACISMCRALGVDPIKFVNALSTLLRGQWKFPEYSEPSPKEPISKEEVIEIEVDHER